MRMEGEQVAHLFAVAVAQQLLLGAALTNVPIRVLSTLPAAMTSTLSKQNTDTARMTSPYAF